MGRCRFGWLVGSSCCTSAYCQVLCMYNVAFFCPCYFVLQVLGLGSSPVSRCPLFLSPCVCVCITVLGAETSVEKKKVIQAFF